MTRRKMTAIQEFLSDKLLGVKRCAHEDDEDHGKIKNGDKHEVKKQSMLPIKSIDTFGRCSVMRSQDDAIKCLGHAFLSLERCPFYSSTVHLGSDISMTILGNDNVSHNINLPSPVSHTDHDGNICSSATFEALSTLAHSYHAVSTQGGSASTIKFRIPAAQILDITSINMPKICADVKDILFPLENGIHVELQEMAFLEPNVQFFMHDEVKLDENVLGGIEVLLPSLFLGGYMDYYSPVRKRIDFQNKQFFDSKLYAKMITREAGYSMENVLKFSTPNPVLQTYAWTKGSVVGPVHISMGIRMSLIFKVTRIVSVVTQPHVIAPATATTGVAFHDHAVSGSDTSDKTSSLLQTRLPPPVELAKSSDAMSVDYFPYVISTCAPANVSTFVSEPMQVDTAARPTSDTTKGEAQVLAQQLSPSMSTITGNDATTAPFAISTDFVKHSMYPRMMDLYKHVVRDLRLFCRDAHLPCTGTKDEIVARLVEKERLQLIRNAPKMPRDTAVLLARHFARELLQVLRNDHFASDTDTKSLVGFPCRHLYEKERDLPMFSLATNPTLKTSELLLQGADAIIAVILAHVGLDVHMYRMGCIDLKAITNDARPQVLYFPSPILPSIRNMQELMSIHPVLLGDRLSPILNLNDLNRTVRHSFATENYKHEKLVPLEQVTWAVTLPKVGVHDAMCLPTYLPLDVLSVLDHAVSNQGVIPQALVNDSYVRQKNQDTEGLYHGRIYMQSAIVVEIPAVGTQHRQQVIERLATWLASPEHSVEEFVDAVREGHIKDTEENNAMHDYNIDLARYSWLDIHSLQCLARLYHLDDRGSAKTILNRISNFLVNANVGKTQAK